MSARLNGTEEREIITGDLNDPGVLSYYIMLVDPVYNIAFNNNNYYYHYNDI